ncbi:unnamed protein product [Callosobruchus maculatus]|nr:unnamed protein product [Callosobruchus maculatus]
MHTYIFTLIVNSVQ